MSLGFEFVVQQLQKGLHHLALSPPLRMKAVSIHEQTVRVHNSSNAHVRASGRRGTVQCTDDLQEVCKEVHEPVTGTVAKLSWVQHPSRVQRMHKAIAIKQEPATLFRNPASAIHAGKPRRCQKRGVATALLRASCTGTRIRHKYTIRALVVVRQHSTPSTYLVATES